MAVMTFPLFAQTRRDGPVLIGTYASPGARRQAMQYEKDQQDSLGGDEITGFTYERSGGAETMHLSAVTTRMQARLEGL